MSIKIIKAGILATVQDTGRTGFRNIGVGSAGAMDLFAMQVSNYLSGNSGDEAVIEINFPAPEILFEQDAIIGISGADFSATLNEVSVPTWRTLFVTRDSILKFRKPVSGARLYLAVSGGWQADQWLGSYSTHLKLGVAGHCGRALKKNDEVRFSTAVLPVTGNKILPPLFPGPGPEKFYATLNGIRYVEGPEYNLLTDTAKRSLEQQNITISAQSDRMGYRLNNEPLSLHSPVELISSPVDAGTVQLLPTGPLIILMADHQTTGGYPRIAAVIKADLPKLAQANPGQVLNFTKISLADAEDAYFNMQRSLEEIKKACHLNLKNILPRD